MRATSARRRRDPSEFERTMMFSNSFGSESRPFVVMV